jgi:hypothetical protein
MKLEKLNHIQEVDAPEFLLTRIMQKIETSKANTFPMSWGLALSFSFALVILFNSIVITKNTSSNDDIDSYAKSIRLTSSNSIYE